MEKKLNLGLIILVNILSMILFMVLLIFLLQFLHGTLFISRNVLGICTIASCPVIWGSIIYMIIKKKTPGHIIAAKVANRKNNQDKTQ